MKKRMIAIACAVVLAMALPMTAWAAQSPAEPSASGQVNGITVTATADQGSIQSVTQSGVAANNVPAGTTPIISFEVLGSDDAANVTISFDLGTKYANHALSIYVQHGDGTNDVIGTTSDAKGNVSFKTEKLSIFSVVDKGSLGDSKVTNDNAKSPQTGVDLGTIAGATMVSAIAAGAVFVALRKKVTE